MLKAKKILSLLIFLGVIQFSFAQETLSTDVLQKVSQAVFEVVVLRPQVDSLEYERPLPIDRLPYLERTDKYMSIGTAFLLNDGKFYSAAHVFNLMEESQNTDYFIRDSEGNVHAIDTLYKFSRDRDFIVFSVKDFEVDSSKGLEIVNQKPDINSSVYTVGNAWGEGIVIRNGVFTSETFENIDGAWKWVRFSAAASPGNSGGPLITREGKVIGIVTMKNQNENLNYALPIQEIENISENTGEFILRVFYRFPNILSGNKYGEFSINITLPKTFEDAREEVKTAYQKFTSDLASDFKSEFDFEGEKAFTNKDLSGEIMYTSITPNFPLTMINHEDRRWGLHYPEDVSEITLPQNGSVEYGVMINTYYVSIKKPDNVSLEELINSPKMYMDYILDTALLWRNMAGERITITSLGEPVETETHTDTFDRTWLVSYWNLEFADYMVITYALPVPGGIFVLMSTNSTGTIMDGIDIDFAFMSDYMYVGYSSTIEEWEEFFSLKKDEYPLYPPFSNMTFSATNNETSVDYTNWKVQLPQNVMHVDDETRMSIQLGYSYDDDTLIQEARGLTLYHTPVTETYQYFSFEKYLKPEEGISRQLTNVWDAIENENYPFNADPYFQDGVTNYYGILDRLDQDTETESAMLLMLELHGDNKEEEMLEFATDAEEAITIK